LPAAITGAGVTSYGKEEAFLRQDRKQFGTGSICLCRQKTGTIRDNSVLWVELETSIDLRAAELIAVNGRAE
jgi:hypothetical protein